MKKSIFLISLVIVLVSCKSKPSTESINAGDAGIVAVSAGTGYVLDPSVSAINWKGTKPGGEHNGNVSISEGNLISENDQVVSGTFTIDLNSITNLDISDTEMNAKLVGHLKSPDFFDVAQFPTAKFEITSVVELPGKSPASENELQLTHQVTGNLVMKGITKSISFPASIRLTGSIISAVTEPFAIDRTQWGVNYGSKSIFAELKDQFIGDEMIISLNLRFNKK